MKSLETSKVALSEKAIELIWKYYVSFSVKKMTVNMERAVTTMDIRRALEQCLADGDKETYKNIQQGTKGWKTLDDSFAKIKRIKA